jgi:O-phosphoseryl-tRNA(Cys) synthetase
MSISISSLSLSARTTTTPPPILLFAIASCFRRDPWSSTDIVKTKYSTLSMLIEIEFGVYCTTSLIDIRG